MSQLESTYPGLICKPYEDLQSARKKNSEAERHFALLDLGESLVVYVAGILLGEYKKSGVIDKDVETELFRHSNRNLSFGQYLGLIRLLHTKIKDSFIYEKLHKHHVFVGAADFVMSFDILKKVVDEGIDQGFTELAEEARKGRTTKKTGFLDFFDCFIKVRNIRAHPEDKAGPKDNSRKWPLSQEYYTYINQYLEPALIEIIRDFEILVKYPCVRSTEDIEDEVRRARFVLERALVEKNVDMTLTKEQIAMLGANQRFLLSPENEVYIRLFYNTIPQINSKVYKEISEAEKAKQMEPHLKQMIRDKLSDDQRIDELEYLVLYDTAKMVSMSEEQLFDLIDKIRKELKIEASLGTPEQPGDLFIKEKEGDKRITFNPWWLHYFSLLPTIDNTKVTSEKDQIKKFDDKIEKLKNELKRIDVSLKSRLDKKKQDMKDEKQKKREIKYKAEVRIKEIREAMQKARTTERKDKLKEDIRDEEERYEQRLKNIDEAVDKITIDIASLEKERVDIKKEYNNKVEEIKQDREAEDKQTTWGRHKYLWKELDQYVDGLLDSNLNNAEQSADEETEESENTSKKWINEANQWQQGKLTYGYWAKIRPAKAPLGNLFHIGLWIGNKFKWLPNDIRTAELRSRVNTANVLIWLSTNDTKLNKIDLNGKLTAKYRELKKQFIDEYENKLLPLNLNVRCRMDSSLEDENIVGFLNEENQKGAFMPLKEYKQKEEVHSMPTLYSTIWTLDDLYNDGLLDLSSVHRLESQLGTLLGWFSNIITKINDYAMELGVDAEYIQRKEEQFGRHQGILHNKFEATSSQGKFNPSKEQLEEWKSYAKEELDVNEYLFNLMLNSYRFKSHKT